MNKICTKCKENKPLEDYYKDAKAKNGRTAECKSCIIVRNKKYAKTDKGKATHAKYRKSNKGKAAHAKYYENNGEQAREQQAEYRKSDRGKSAYAKAKAKYQRTEKGKAAIARDNCNKRNWKSKTINDLTIKESNMILFLKNYQCANPNCECKYGRYFDMVEPTLDHIKPISKGGDLIKENIQYLCQSCNSKKSIQYIDYRSELHKELIKRI